MEFNKKLQELRKERGLTQEELSKILFVSRTAVSKWESGRGYPNLDSLKQIAKYFNLSVDELLSGNELLSVAIQDGNKKRDGFLNLLFGLIDISFMLFFFLPFFAQRLGGNIYEVNLIELSGISVWLKIIYYILLASIIICGVLTLILTESRFNFCNKIKKIVSLILNVIIVIAFIATLQTYPSSLSFTFFLIKIVTFIKT